MRSRTNIALVLTLLLIAASPLATSIARSRAVGNRRDVAVRIGASLFTIEWPAQVLKVRADGANGAVVVGLVLSGTKFHRVLTQTAFLAEIDSLVQRSFAADPTIDEVDAWVIIPVPVAPGAIVSGSLAVPTSRTVFTVSVLRSESAATLKKRLATGRDIYWDEDWRRSALKRTP